MCNGLTVALIAMPGAVQAQEKTEHVYEMRTYYAPEGRLDDLHARFRNHTVKLFEKHGITNIGYWTPIDNKENKLVYIPGEPSPVRGRLSVGRVRRAELRKEPGEAVKKETEAKGPIERGPRPASRAP